MGSAAGKYHPAMFNRNRAGQRAVSFRASAFLQSQLAAVEGAIAEWKFDVIQIEFRGSGVTGYDGHDLSYNRSP